MFHVLFLIRYIFLYISLVSPFLLTSIVGDRTTYYRNLKDINPLSNTVCLVLYPSCTHNPPYKQFAHRHWVGANVPHCGWFYRCSTRDPSHEQLLVRLGVGGVSSVAVIAGVVIPCHSWNHGGVLSLSHLRSTPWAVAHLLRLSRNHGSILALVAIWRLNTGVSDFLEKYCM